MRITLLAVAMALFASVLPVSAQALTQHYQLNIPRQPLDAALKDLAQQTGMQIARFSDAPRGIALVVGPVSGDMSFDRALTSLLASSGLTYKVVNDRTIAVVAPGAGSGADPTAARRSHDSQLSYSSAETDDGNREKKSFFWNRFLMAQTDQGTSSSAAPVEKPNQETSREKVVRLEEVIVTAQKREERLKDVPISVSVLSGDDIDRSSLVSVTDALSNIPGVVVQAAGSGTQISVRGVGASTATFSGSNTVAYYLDSVPFGLVYSAVVPDSNAYDLERIEVLKGPQGTLYGSSAQNGVVRILTHDADLNQSEFKARTGFSSTDGVRGGNYSGDMALNVPIVEGKVAARAVVSYQNLGGWIDNLDKHGTNDAQLRSYRLKINARPTEQLSIGLSAWSSRDNYGAPPTAPDNGVYPGAIAQPIVTDFDAYGFKIGYEFSHVSVSSMTSYLDYKNDGTLDLTALFGVPASLLNGFGSNVFAQEILFNSKNIGAWRWSAGAFYRDAKDTLLQDLPGFLPVPYFERNTSKSYAVFGELGRRFLHDKFEWILGARHFHDDVSHRDNESVSTDLLPAISDSFNSTTPRAVLAWHPNEDLTVYSSYSEGFRSGFAQAASVVSAFPSIPSVKPDKLHNYEIGAKGDLPSSRISFETALYYMKWNDVQQINGVIIGGLPISAPVNGKSASGLGFDFGVAARPVERLNLGVSLSWNDLAQDSDVFTGGFVALRKGARLNSSSEYTAGASADYTVPFGGTGFSGTLSASARYWSKQTLTTLRPGAPSSIKVGDPFLITRTAFTLVSPNRWTAVLFADNVNNEKGGYPSVHPFFRSRVRPRTIGVQFDYKFQSAGK